MDTTQTNSQTGEPRRVYRFGDCVLDAANRELSRAGRVVEVQSKAFDLLLYLIEHRDRIIDKDELQNAVWAGRIVSEAALTRCVMKARRAVGDDAERQTSIKTVHGHGYRFVATLVEAAEVQRAYPKKNRGLRWLGAAAAVIAILAVSPFVIDKHFQAEEQLRVAVLPFENTSGEAELDWAEFGLMNLALNVVRSGGVQVVSAHSTVKAIRKNADVVDDSVMEKLRRAYAATHIVSPRLERTGDLLRVSYSITGPDGRSDEKSVIGTEVTAITNEMSRNIINSVTPFGQGEYRLVSTDAFVNEAYARGMSLQLQGKANEAIGLFKVASEQAPESFWPRYEYALATRILGDIEAAEKMLLDLLAEERSETSYERAANLNAIGIIYWRQRRYDEAEAELSKGLEVAEQLNDGGLAGALLTNLAILAKNRDDFALARERLERSLASYKQGGFEVPPGSLFNSFATLALREGDLDSAEINLSKALESYRFEGERRLEATVLNNLGNVRRRQGKFKIAESLHRDALQLHTELEYPAGRGKTLFGLAQLYLATGELTLSMRESNVALEIARDMGDPLREALIYSHQGLVSIARRDTGAAESHFNKSKSLLETAGGAEAVLQQDLNLARVSILRGEYDEARQIIGSVKDDERAPDFNVIQAQIHALLGEVEYKQGNTEKAVSLLTESLEQARGIDDASLQIAVTEKLANIRLDNTDIYAAEPLIGLAIKLQPESYETLKLRARTAHLKEAYDTAAQLMAEAKQAANERWTAEDETTLQSYTIAVALNQ
ncbi:MAG: tetratricopeptide repeat protein [Gammaproteobacteria bacterium]|nr:tetratricopeptide repeat protein [Gammaproteobacteria bacterium]